MPVEHSIRGRQLRFASPDYRREIQAGLGLVLNGILLIIVCFISLTVLASAGVSPLFVSVGLGFGMVAISIMIAVGYWRYTTPDPGFALAEQANSARAVARIAVVVGAACLLGKTIVELLLSGSHTHPAQMPTGVSLLRLVTGSLALLQLVAWVVQFFSVMTYTAWVAGRIPDDAIVRKARRYRWLLPLIAILGLPLFMLGPLFALVRYWNLLHALRKQIKAMG